MKNTEQLEDVYKLSPMQEGMLFHALKDTGSPAYFEQTLLTLRGEIDSKVLEESFNRLIERYDVLRTVFYFENLKQPLQIVLKKRRLQLGYRDISHFKDEKKDALLSRFLEKDRERGFDLSGDLLMRVTLFKTGPGIYKLLWSTHHIVMDGWCLGIVFRDLLRIYRAMVKTGMPEKSEPAVPYRKYIEWLEKQDKEGGLRYWREYLEGYDRPALLPVSPPLSRTREYIDRVHTVEAGISSARDLTGIALRNKVPLTVVFQALWGLLLQKYNNTDDVVFGMVVSGRSPEIEGVEKIVGLFINTVPLRVKRGENKTFLQLLKALHRREIKSKEMEYLSLADIQAASPLKNRLIRVLTAFQNYPVEEDLKNAGQDPETGFRVEAVESFEQTHYDLNIVVTPTGSISIAFKYNAAVYPEAAVVRAAQHFKHLMLQVAADPGIALDTLETVTPEEKKQILFDFNKIATGPAPKPSTIRELFEAQVEKTPDHLALIGPIGPIGPIRPIFISYRELNNRAGRLAASLSKRGLGPGSIIGLSALRSVGWVTGILGILKAGAAWLPIEAGLPPARADYMLKDSRAAALVTLSSRPGEGETYAIQEQSVPSPGPTPTDLAYVIYTSGTTGKPKGTLLEHKGIANLKAYFEKQLRIGPGDRVLQFAQIGFDASVWEVFMVLLTGAALCIVPDETIGNRTLFEDFLNRHRVTAATLPPTYAVYLDARRISTLRLLITAGSETHRALVDNWRTRVEYINAYGPTETTVCASSWSCAPQSFSDASTAVPIGKPLPGTHIFIMNSDNRLQPVGIPGELCISGTGLARGYLNRVELTAERFIPHPLIRGERLYRTGDLGRWRADGNIEFLGRTDAQVKVRGYRVEPAEIEHRLSAHPAVKAAVVTAVKEENNGGHDLWNYYLCAYIVREEPGVGIGELKEYLSLSLPPYMIPARFVFLEALPLTSTGKVDRGALPAPGFPVSGVYTAPADPVEEKLAAIWADVLGLEKESIGTADDFFALGGHSLKTTIAAGRIYKELEVKVPVSTFFRYSRLGDLAEYIRGASGETYSSIRPTEKKEYYPMSLSQQRFYMLQQTAPLGTAYNMPQIMRLSGEVDAAKLEETFRTLIARHESLRTSFETVDNRLVQRVHDTVSYSLDRYDLKRDRAEVKTGVENGAFERPFDLGRAPLFRTVLIKTLEEKYILMVDMHHIITDGISRDILTLEFQALYAGGTLPPPVLQYRDFSQWQNRLLESGELEEDEHYWLSLFQGKLPFLDLPTDFPRPERQSFEGESFGFRSGKDLARKIDRLCRETGNTLYMFLLAAFNVLLSRFGGCTDIIVGSPAAGRNHPDLENIVGLVMGTLVTRNYPDKHKAFREFLEEVKENTLRAFRHHAYPFESLLNRLDYRHTDSPSRNPLFDVGLVVQNEDECLLKRIKNRDTGGLRVTPYAYRYQRTSRLDMTLTAGEEGDDISFHLEYCTALFRPRTMERFSRHFLALLKAIVREPDREIGAFTLTGSPGGVESFSCYIIGGSTLPVRCAEILLRYGHRALGIISRDPRVIGWCKEKNIPFITSFNFDSAVRPFLSRGVFDYLFSIDNGRILPPEILALPRKRAINYHDSPLPRYAGMNAAGWAIMNRETRHAVTWHEMDNGIDTGDILEQLVVDIDPGETAGSLNMKCYEAAVESFEVLVSRLETGTVVPRPQDPAERTYFHFYRRPFAASIITFDRPAEDIGAFVRALDFGGYPNPLGAAKIVVDGNFFIVAEVSLSTSHSDDAPGTVTRVAPGSLVVSTGSGDLEIRKILTLEGKEVSPDQLAKPNRLRPGNTLNGIDTDQVHRIDRLNRLVCKYENSWLKGIRRLKPLSFPYAAAAGGGKVSVIPFSIPVETVCPGGPVSRADELVITYLAWLCRVTNRYTFDTGYGDPLLRREVNRLEKLFSLPVPFRVKLDPGFVFSRCREILQAELARVRKRKTFIRDLFYRYRHSLPSTVLRDFEETVSTEVVIVSSLENSLPEPVSCFRLVVPEKGDECVCLFDSARFNGEDIQRLLHHFTVFLKGVVSDPSLPLGDLPLLDEEDRYYQLEYLNDTRSDYRYDVPLHRLFEAQVERVPGNTAAEGPALTYRELNEKAEGLARLLRRKGVIAGSVVGIMADRSPLVLAGLLGILKAGCAYLPIEPGYPIERKRFMLRDGNAAILLSDAGELGELDRVNGGIEVVSLSTPFEEIGDNLLSPIHSTHAAQLCYILYTSGSTGIPRGVSVTHRNVAAYIHAFDREFQLRETDVVLQQASYCFDVFVEEVYPILTKGGMTVIARGDEVRDIDRLVRVIEDYGVTVVTCTPQLLSRLNRFSVSAFRDPLRSVHTFISGGDILESGHVDHLIDSARVYNTYGPTETTVCAAYYKCCKEGMGVGTGVPIGKPISNYNIYLLDESHRLVPLGLPGEICISGPGVSPGYINNPESTAERFSQKFSGGPGGSFSKASPWGHGRRRQELTLYYTGDMGRWLPGGILEFIGRKDNQVKVRGYRVELSEIEHTLLKREGIESVVVTSRVDRNGDSFLCAYIVCRSFRVPRSGELRDHLSSFLPGYMIPSRFVFLEELPLTDRGKVDRRALPEPGWVPDGETVSPRDSVEEKLLEIWSEVLGIDRASFGVTSNFFELGGHSLNAAVMASKIHQRFHVNLPLGDIFKRPYIETLARHIASSEKTLYSSIEPAVPVLEGGYYLLSAAQRRLFFLAQMENAGTAYNVSFAFDVEGEIDKPRFEKTFGRLIRRHEGLRTSFHFLNGEPYQKVHGRVVFEVEYREGGEGFIRPFDLSAAPLLRVAVVETGMNRHVLWVDLHHIIADGTSLGILANEFSRLYNNENEKLPELRTRYRDFAARQNRLYRTGGIREQEEYWLRQFGDAGGIPLLNLPVDFSRPGIFDFRGSYHEFALDAGDTGRFKALVARTGATVYMGLAAVFTLMLHKYSGQEDIIIGTGIAGRHHADLQNIIGMFVNTLPLRTRPGGEKTFSRYLHDVKEVTLNAFENRDLQLEELVDRINPERDPSRNPLFDVSLVLQNFKHPSLALKGLKVEPHRFRDRTSKFDITLYAFEGGDRVDFQLEYCTSLFEEATVRRMAGHLLTVIRQVGRTPGLPISDIDMMTPGEREELLHTFNAAPTPYPYKKTIHRLFEEQVERTPDHTALVGPDDRTVLSYGALNEGADRVAGYLHHAKKLECGQPVGVLTDRSIDLIIVLLGILKAGGVYLPIDPVLPEERIKILIRDAGAVVLFSQKRFIRTLHRLQWDCSTLHTFVCIDTSDIHREEETEKSGLMDQSLWDFVAEKGEDDITTGGWVSSFTGTPFSREEMDEYAKNTLHKLDPLLKMHTRVLEIGCSSGITMFRIAPRVGFYYGTDISEAVIRKKRERVEEEAYINIKLSRCAAHEIDRLEERDFDLIILNSVIQAFHGHNYLRSVIGKCVDLLKSGGHLFIGDIMNPDSKRSLIRELEAFKNDPANMGKGYKTKTEFAVELFVAPGYFEDLAADIPFIVHVQCTPKLRFGEKENELTRFRYDALLEIDKNRRGSGNRREKKKYQEDASALALYRGGDVLTGVSPDDPAYLIYTSGTTGSPGGVLVEHRGIVNLNMYLRTGIGAGVGDRVLQFANIAFDASVWEIFAALLNGAALYIVSPRVIEDYASFENYLEGRRISIVTLPPPYLDHLNPERVTTLRTLISAGSTIDWPLADRWRGRVRLVNAYGPTEATICAAAGEVPAGENGSPRRAVVSIGRPLLNTRVCILDKRGQLQPAGIAGELCIAGPGLARGYLNNPELTAERFYRSDRSYWSYRTYFDPLYKTGDLARWTGDGLEFLGRIDQQLKIRGIRIEPSEIEARIQRLQTIERTVVTSGENNRGEQYLCAYFVSGSVIASAELREFLARQLPSYMIPDYFIRVPEIPLTANGKIDRKALPSPQSWGMTEGEITPIADSIERKVAEIWAGVLGIESERIGGDSSFFDLGGHSLRAITVVSRIHKELSVKVPLAEVFRCPTLAGLSRYIKTARPDVQRGIEAAEKKEYYPLSYAQKRLYVVQQFAGDGTVYNMPVIVALEGKVEKEKLEQAFKALIHRHESLRTSIHIIDGEPVQRVHSHVDFAVRESDLPGIRQFIRPFDLSRAPLLRAGLIKESGGRFILVIDFHHIVSDGVSRGILVKDFAALSSGGSLSPLPLQYRDYAQWQQRADEREGGYFREQEKYWMECFREDVPVLKLPLDHQRPAVQRFEGETLGFTLPSEIVRELKALADGQNATLFIVLSALFSILLSRLSGQEDIVVGTPAAGRRHADLLPIVGMFVNTLALRSRPAPTKTFGDFLREVKAHALEAFENQDYPFETLVDQLARQGKITRDTGRNPLCDVMFALQNMDMPDARLPGLHILPVPYENKTSRFDLSLSVVEEDRQLHFNIEYCTRLFNADTIRTYSAYLENIISSALEDPDKPLFAIELLTPEEKQRLIEDFNHNAAVSLSEKTVSQCFEEQAAKKADRVVLIGPIGPISFRVVDERADRIARQLRQRGIGPGTVAAVKLERSVDLIIALIGILKAGSTYLPVDPALPRERIDYMLRDSNAAILLSEVEHDIDHTPTRMPLRPVQSLHPACIIYTSGSTGRPGGVIIEHRGIVRLVKDPNYIEWKEKQRLLLTGSVCFDITLFEIWGPLLNGYTLCLAEQHVIADADRMREYLQKHDISILHLVPQLFLQLASQRLDLFSGLEYLLVGGDLVRPAYINNVRGMYPRLKIMHMYGPTENTTFSTFQPVETEYRDFLPLGRPVSRTRVYILDAYHRPVPIGVEGELCVSGDGVARGYLDRPEQTAEKFILDPFVPGTRMYKTGDRARWTADLNIQFLGRADRQVKIRGIRIELEEIESRLSAHESVKESVVEARDSGTGDHFLCAYIKAKSPDPGAWSETNIREYLSQYLPRYMIPTVIVPVETFPLTSSGKIDRNALPAPAAVPSENNDAPVRALEKKLAVLWAELPGITKRDNGLHDNFFRLGGHSLTAALLVSRIQKEFNVKVSLVEIFKRPTIKELADHILPAAETPFTSIRPVPKKEYYAVSPMQKRLFILHQLEGVGTAYNLPHVLQIRGELEREKLENAFRGLIKRHQGLRTSFFIAGGHPVQKVHEHVEFEIEYKESGINEPLSFISRFIRPFDLSLPPLQRAGLIKTAHHTHILVMDVHHIISDGTSTGILVKDLTSLYRGDELPPLPLQYRDFSEWLQSPPGETALLEQETFWLETFNDPVSPLNLPTDFPRPTVQSFNGSKVHFELGHKIKEKMYRLMEETGTTLYMVMLAVLNVLLYRVTGTGDIVIGTPAAGREHPDLQHIVGLFINVLAMRNYPRRDKTVKTFLDEVRENALAAFENQGYPYDRLLEKIDVEKDPGRNPLFDIELAVQNMESAGVEIEELRFTPFEYDAGVTQVDIGLYVSETVNAVHITLVYCTRLFKRETMERFAGFFKEIAVSVCENPGAALGDIAISHRLQPAGHDKYKDDENDFGF